MKFQICSGDEAAPLVNPFYEEQGQQTRARTSDLFFLMTNQDVLIASVRYCLEEEAHLLRGMMIHERHRRKGIGKILLKQFELFLNERQISPAYCVPHSYLESFYGTIGFRPTLSGPQFLNNRVSEYNKIPGRSVILMKRE